MKEKIIEDGQLLRVKEVKRGCLLVYSEDEWAKRSKGIYKKREDHQTLLAATYAGLIIANMAMQTNGFQDLQSIDLAFITFMIAMMALMVVFLYLQASMNRNPPAVAGIYENGVQLLTHAFLPYPEIGKIERTTTKGFRGPVRETISFGAKGDEKTIRRIGWSFTVEFLGMSGMARLKERLEVSRGIGTGRPALVIYAPVRDSFYSTGLGMASEVRPPDIGGETY